jgi:aminoglycoside phosphotransferase (APT) family kinase protein
VPTPDQVVATLKSEGFLPPDADPRPQRLAGGVSSDVFRIETPQGPLCVKGALETLRVAADWRAPLERSHVEADWLRTAHGYVGSAVPQVLFESRAANLFVMSYYEPDTHPVWKQDLAAGRVRPDFARQVGVLLAQIHAGAAGSPEVAARFATGELFEALRLEPYFRHAAAAHPDLAAVVTDIADRTAATRLTLVHGDVSPKNILQGPDGPVFLDAECAWYGDPAFDLAFCACHLMLKTVWRPAHSAAYLESLDALIAGYLPGVAWELPGELSARAGPLAAAMLLARVDGKSPVEYLTAEADRAFVRGQARALLASDPASLAEVVARWKKGLEQR